MPPKQELDLTHSGKLKCPRTFILYDATLIAGFLQGNY